MIVLDTNIVSELQNVRPSSNVLRWMLTVDVADTFICGPVLMEQAYGAERLFLKTTSTRYRETLALMREEYAARTLPITGGAFELAGRLRAQRENVGRPLSIIDSMIAAICLSHGATLATRSIRDFDGLDLKLVNPFGSSSLTLSFGAHPAVIAGREPMPLRIIFMGTPDFSVATLRAVTEAGHDVVAVYTQPPRPAGRRGLETTPSPVQREAERLGIEVRTPVSLKGEDEQQAFRALGADVAVVVAYGLLLPRAILEGTRLGCYNGHASLLPRWRGAAPIQRAIMAGDTETGMMIMKMDVGLDTGPVAMTERVAIGRDMTAGELHDRLMNAGAALMVEALSRLENDTLPLTPQAETGVTYASKIDKGETRVDWNRSAAEVHNHIRGLSPFPGAWCEAELGGKIERLKLLRSALAEGQGAPGLLLDDSLTVACGTGAVRIAELQRAGGKPVSAAEFLRGAHLAEGQLLR